MPSTLHLNDESSNDPAGICELYATYFSSVYTPPAVPSGRLIADTNTSIAGFLFTRSEVVRALSSLDDKKGCGPDLIPPNVLKHCAHLLADPVLELFNHSVSNGVFPDVFKQGYIIPIHKSGSKEDAKNYRPIVIQPALAKVFEKLVLTRLDYYFHNIISPNQHGFFSQRSTTTNLVCFQSHVIAAFAKRSQLDAIYLDFSKAFDRVSHLHLLSKLEAYGVTGYLLQWFKSYLEDRRLKVRFSGKLSSDVVATSGVPQGSHLGPLLFNIFINDIVTTSENSSCLLFADDIKLFRIISSADDCFELQRSLQNLQTWCDRNSMDLNIKKCFCISFYRIKSPVLFQYQLGDDILNRLNTARDLGVLLTQNLNPDEHIHQICSKAYRNLGLIRRSTIGMHSPEALKILYCTLVRPILEYCSVVWSPHQTTLQDMIQKVQNRFLRVVGTRLGFNYTEVPVEQLAVDLGLQSLATRRKRQDIIFLFKLINNHMDCPELLAAISFRCRLGTRSRDLFWRRHFGSNYEMNSPMDRVQRQGNGVSSLVDLFNPSLSAFKRELHRVF